MRTYSKISIAICLIILPIISFGQEWNWAKNFMATSGNGIGSDVVFSSSGIGYLAIRFSGTLTIGNLTYTAAGVDILIAKLKSNGDVEWAKHFNSTDYPVDYGLKILTDSANNLYVGYRFTGNAQIGGKAITNLGKEDFVIFRLSKAGKIDWLQHVGGLENDIFYLEDVTVGGDVLVSGTSNSNAVRVFTPISSAYPTINLGKNNGNHYLLKYSQFGSTFQYRQFNFYFYAHLNKHGECIINGSFEDTLIVLGDTLLPASAHNLFICKLSSNFQSSIYSKVVAHASEEFVLGMNLDHQDNIFLTGYFYSDTLYFDSTAKPNQRNRIHVKLDSNGRFIWATPFDGGEISVQNVSFDNAGSSYITGDFFTSFQVGDTTIAASGEPWSYSDVYAFKLDSNGIVNWCTSIGSADGDEYAVGIAADPRGNAIIIGLFNHELIIGADTLNPYNTLGDTELFIAKIRGLNGSNKAYHFIGNGYWSDSSNWQFNNPPPVKLMAGDTVYIQTIPPDSCLLDVPYSFLDQAVLSIKDNARLVITGNINFNDTTFTDPRDGEVYPIKKYGSQVWMTSNFRLNTSKSKVYNNENSNVTLFGRLYNWQEAKYLAPPGWHLPSQQEWQTLVQYIGDSGNMKDTLYWDPPNTGATNSSNFNVRGSGIWTNGSFESLGVTGVYWTSTQKSQAGSFDWAQSVYFASYSNTVSYFDNEKEDYWLSVRYVKD